MNARIVGSSLAVALLLGVASTTLAGSAQSAYVTTDVDCDAPIDLQVNQLAALSDGYVWLKRISEEDLANLVWTLSQGGNQVSNGTFTFICTTTDGKYTLALPGFEDGGSGTYTLKVDFTNGKNYSGDSFSVD